VLSNGFCSNNLSAARAYCGEWYVLVDHPQCSLDHIAAIVYFSDNSVGSVISVRPDGNLRPLNRRVSPGKVPEHVTISFSALTSHHNSGFVSVFA